MRRTRLPNLDLENWLWKVALVTIVISYGFLLWVQLNKYPLERYPGWDNYWTDALLIGKLSSLGNALKELQIPILNPYFELDWNVAGDTTLPVSPLYPINYLVLFLSAAQVASIRSLSFFVLGAIGAFAYLREMTKRPVLACMGAFSYVSPAIVVGTLFYHTMIATFLCMPVVYFSMHRSLHRLSWTRLLGFVASCLLVFSVSDVYALLIVPTSVAVYVLVLKIASGDGFIRAVERAGLLAFLCILSAAFFIMPLYSNLRDIAPEARDFLEVMNLKMPVRGVHWFVSFLSTNGIDSIWEPFQGSALVMYAPLFLCALAVFAVATGRFAPRRPIRPEEAAIIALVLSALCMFVISLIYYSVPIVRLGHGVLRYHLNLLPFNLTLAGFIGLAVLADCLAPRPLPIRLSVYGAVLTIQIIGALALMTPITRVLPQSYHSSNLIPVAWVLPTNPLDALPFVHGFLFAITVLWIERERLTRAYWEPALFISLAAIITLFTVSIYNEIQFRERTYTRDPYFRDVYTERDKCIDGLIDRSDPNYRTVYAAKSVNGQTRNWKVHAETELESADFEKSLFSFRETMRPYVGMLWTALDSMTVIDWSNLVPPDAQEINSHADLLRLLGVKWIISADQRLTNEAFDFKGVCFSRPDPFSRGMGGPVYVYEIKDPMPVAFLEERAEVHSRRDAWRRILSDAHPWINGVVWVDREKSSVWGNVAAVPQEPAASRITHETFNSVSLSVKSPTPSYLVLSYVYRKGWSAFVNGKPMPIMHAYGGMMSVKVPSGTAKVEFIYSDISVVMGYAITLGLIAFLCVFAVVERKRPGPSQTMPHEPRPI